MCSRMTRTNFDGRLLNSYCPHHSRFSFLPWLSHSPPVPEVIYSHEVACIPLQSKRALGICR